MFYVTKCFEIEKHIDTYNIEFEKKKNVVRRESNM